MRLISNARPDGLEPEDVAAFDTVHVAERADMAGAVPPAGRRILVLDTIAIPGIETLSAPLVLILRETPEAELGRFRLAGGRAWDRVIAANPRGHWMPQDLAAREVLPVGWIYRPTGTRLGSTAAVPLVLLTTGGGGKADAARSLYAAVDDLLSQAREVGARFHVVQSIGPRAQGFGRLQTADTMIDPGGRLNTCFREADVVLSTAGYNSVLELATTDTPTMLLPMPRSIDDQSARARHWGPRLGTLLDPAAPEVALDWFLQQVAVLRRRPPVDLGPSGEGLAAQAILSLG